MRRTLTLCMVCKEDQILLGMKKRGFGAGRWNGFGGKVEEGESIEEAATREMKEEVSIVPITMFKTGILEFSFQKESLELEVHIFKVTSYEGEPCESEEMRPQWFAWSEVPFLQMWVDDQYWFPFLQTNELFMERFVFDCPATEERQSIIVQQELLIVEALK